jgi:hypothetical protein
LFASPGETVSTSAQIVVKWQGSKHLKADSSINISANPSGITLPSGYTISSIASTVPVDWDGNTDYFTGNSNIEFTAPTSPGFYTYDVRWTASGYSCVTSGCISSGINPFKIYLVVDATPPVIGYTLTPSSPDGENGWYVSDVSLVWSVTDPESPVTKIDCVDQSIVADQAEITYSCSATSAGGSTGPVSVSIKRDATPPTVALVDGPADGGSYYFGFVPPAPTCSASDALSGLDGVCSVSGYSGLVGVNTVTASAADLAGNTASVSASYTVLPWTLNGFYQPVDMGDVWNIVKGGSTVPFKFEVFAGATELTDTAVVSSFVAAPVACPVTGVIADAIEITTTGVTSLRYDLVEGQFINNWQTPKKPGTCYVVTMTTEDGSSLAANFKLK